MSVIAEAAAEGGIKFHCDWRVAEEPVGGGVRQLMYWRSRLHQAGLIGVDENGIGFGNLSLREPGTLNFIVTGTQTGGVEGFGAEHLTRVVGYDISKNMLSCEGPVKASSESLTHAMVYEMSPAIQAVAHAHHIYLWRALKGKAPTSSESVPYGTPEMAAEVRRLFETTDLKDRRIMVMGGHENGLLAFGGAVGEASEILLSALRNAEDRP